MFSDLKNVLYDGIKNDLQENGYAKELLFLLEKQTSVPDIKQLVAINTNNDHSIELQEFEKRREKSIDIEDGRLLSLSLRGIRKFPAKDGLYTVYFSIDDDPVSSVFLGSNGIGKSSLFASLEYITLGHSYLADERGYKTDEGQKDYLHNNQANFNDVLIKITSKKKSFNKSITLTNNADPIATPAFFCSEYDIQAISTAGLSPDYICRQLGLEQYYCLLTRMRGALQGNKDSNTNTNNEVYQKLEEQKKAIKNLERRIRVKQFLSSITKDKHLEIYRDYIKNELTPLVESDSLPQNISNLLEKLEVFISRLPESNVPIDTELALCINEFFNEIKIHLSNSSTDKIEVVLKDDAKQIREFIDIWMEGTNKLLIQDEKNIRTERYNYIRELSEDIHALETYKESNKKILEQHPIWARDKKSIDLFQETLSYLEKQYKRLLEESIKIINSILQHTFKDFFNNDIKNIMVHLNETKLTIEAVIDVPGANSIEPRKFLNTFRFKMFCFLFKFSLLCCVKKHHRVNFPFIVDDVFDASDFDNRNMIGNLFEDLYTIHNEITNFEKEPFQLIFFTQDNLIANSIRQDFYSDSVKISRIFDIDYIDEATDLADTDEHKYLKIEDRINETVKL